MDNLKPVEFTHKQAELIRAFALGELKRINILEGSVRSGKTWISIILWALWVCHMPDDQAYLMVGKTLTTLKHNVLEVLVGLVGEDNFQYNTSTKEGRLFGRKMYLEGVNDTRAEGKIRGVTLAGAYCDEITLFTRDFFSMLLSRLSVPGAKLIGTTNPDHPSHWLKTEYLDRVDALNMRSFKFLLEDNTFLDPAYIEALKKEYTGVFYDRFILGLWVAAEGRIYDMFDPAIHVREDCSSWERLYVAIDYGTTNPCTFGLYGVRSSCRHLIREYYYDSKKHMRQKTDAEYSKDLRAFIGMDDIEIIYVDPSAASFIVQLEEDGFPVQPAHNDVLDGIRVMAREIQAGRYTVDPSCKDTIRELQSYAWDSKAAERGEDKPIKTNDHTCDRDRYAIYSDLNDMADVLDKRSLGVM